ncbi:hypothetical protein P175DRAFT_0508551 [Aspergillus ochraceoroseus IBT 24754]|uniref:Rhodopsin domain-containing protein n=1 Tax=Aspergillus ochraceoroseus IBT 24754 TaxID=1392256 RepID=A0A2T5LZ88_9EURO|nr:uncharacterized protein P175DRAFT_0508551 [Aspergillus ochraceoroseus IBT 24754]PTU21599.1 hypothetical protein P175DRAFT_0508551 [Aspergillus ochraceoroseus IBT 24754]
MTSSDSPEYLAQSKVTDLIVCYSIPIPLEILSTALRLWAQQQPWRGGLAFDDILMIWATGDYVFSHFYDFAIASTKLSVLALYYRLFPTQKFRFIVTLTAGFVFLWLATMEFVLGFQCRPIQKFWNSEIPGKCFDLVAFSYFTNITNLATDIWIFVLPLPIILRLQISRPKKIGLSFLFSVGLATCAVSAVRLSVVVSQGSSDFTWAGVPLGILSVWEPLGGILCANLPIIYKPLVTAFRRAAGLPSADQSGAGVHDSWYRLDNSSRSKGNARLISSQCRNKDHMFTLSWVLGPNTTPSKPPLRLSDPSALQKVRHFAMAPHSDGK